MDEIGTKYGVFEISLFSMYTSSGIYNNPRKEALNWI